MSLKRRVKSLEKRAGTMLKPILILRKLKGDLYQNGNRIYTSKEVKELEKLKLIITIKSRG